MISADGVYSILNRRITVAERPLPFVSVIEAYSCAVEGLSCWVAIVVGAWHIMPLEARLSPEGRDVVVKMAK